MPNFSQQIPGEPEPRGFRYDVAEQALYTDMDVEDPVGGMAKQEQAKITAESAAKDSRHELYWAQTYTHREAYRLCEEEGISLEEALAIANGQKEPTYTPLPIRDGSPKAANNGHPNRPAPEPDNEPDAEPEGASPIAAIALKELLLINQMLLTLLDQYINEDDKNYAMVELLKTKTEEVNEYEIII